MISDEDLKDLSIESIRYLIDKNLIPTIGSVTIDSRLVGRIDIIINKYYNGNLDYINLLLDYNNVNDESEIGIGMVFELPNIELLKEYTYIENIDEENIPGINKSIDSRIINNSKITNNQVANSRLKIESQQIKYDSETGKIIL